MELKAYKQKTKKIALYLASTLVSVIFLAASIFYGLLYFSKPQYDGSIKIPGLKQKVEITRDQFGVPHINATSDEDGFFALGFTMASERLFQMEMARRISSGELSEIVGEKALKSDIMFRSIKLRETMATRLVNKELDPLLKKRAEAFYRGINYYQQNFPLPVEFKLLGITPRPFSLLDAYSFVGFMSYSFAVALTQDVMLTHLEKRLGPKLTEEMRSEKINSQALNAISLNKIFDHSIVPNLIADIEKGFFLFDGSNGWLLDKNRTATNSNLLLNDPHISYSLPQVWFEAHIKTPNYESYGHFLPMIPFPILSHNQKFAWGLTMSLTDDMDLYKERIENGKYFNKGAFLPLKVTPQIIKVKGSKDYSFLLYETSHGPLLNELLDEKNLALRWSYYDADNDPLYALFKMGESQSMEEFKKGVALGVTPGLNVLYADKDNIAWWMFGRVYKKPKKMRSDFILDGSNPEDDYQEYMSIDEKPHLENPKSGVIVSANSRPFNFPKEQRGDWQPSDRFNTISSLLNQKEKWSVDELKEVQCLNMNFENKLMLSALLDEVEVTSANEKYVKILKEWDFISDKDAVAPSLYFSLINKIGLKVLESLTIEEKENYGKIATSYIFIKNLILNKKNAWWEKFNRKKVINESLIEVINFLKSKYGDNEKNWIWGNLHTITYVHPLGRVKPLNLIFNLGPYPISGAYQDINNQKYHSFKNVFEVNAGPSTRRIIDFSDLNKSLGITPVGNSGHLLSPFYKNQIDDFNSGKYRAMQMNFEEIAKNSQYKLILNP